MTDILKEASQEALTDAIDRNVIDLFKEYDAPAQLDAVIFTEPHLLQLVTNMEAAIFNPVVGANIDLNETKSAIETAISRCRERNVSMLWWVGPLSRPADLGKHLKANGLQPAGEVPGMALDLSALDDAQKLPDGLTIFEVSDDEMMTTWTETLIFGFGMPEAWKEPMGLWMSMAAKKLQGTFRHYLGFLNGEPVATASVYLGAGVAGIYNIATVEAVRGKGIGRAMTVAPLLDAREEGYQYSILHASEMGHSVYEKIGYRDYCTIYHYTWSPDSAEQPQ